MRSRTIVTVLPVIFVGGSFQSARADFSFADYTAVESNTAVAWNEKTGDAIVAYLVDLAWRELHLKRLNARSRTVGNEIFPFGTGGTHQAIGRPAIAYNSDLDRFLVAVRYPEVLRGPAGGPETTEAWRESNCDRLC